MAQTTNTMPAITYQNVGYQPFSGGQSTTVFKFDPETSKKLYGDQQKRQEKLDKWNVGMQAGIAGLNSIGNITSMALNYSLQSKYLGIQETIAQNQFDLGMRGMDLEFKRLDTTERMGRENMVNQQRLARIQSQTAVAISAIKQKGKTKRAEVFAAMNAFQRTNYQYGTPTFQTSVMS